MKNGAEASGLVGSLMTANGPEVALMYLAIASRPLDFSLPTDYARTPPRF